MVTRRLSTNVHIDLQPIRQGILLPFHDRPAEMRDLAKCNDQFFRNVRDTISEPKFTQLMELWLEKSRAEVPDADFLMTTRNIMLSFPSNEEQGHQRSASHGSTSSATSTPKRLSISSMDPARIHLWRQFCNVVGYDMPTPGEQKEAPPSPAQEAIPESPVEEAIASDSDEEEEEEIKA
ncbi:Schizosaccharomyces specific protein [Schizosaccharomyces pombe]|uniref:Uncharacterized protein C191.01 n=1 Tax=Schizosaccharomyces pombe (strain 972 / ATCC 24843) TaxID=284812 RepID=YQ61_SCHPO|nr:uncharacterized protein SPCC191.01 [Schizosaccharomyces pombe]O94733.1 RecName: Full=Uncharacterized protein C191.01 [Schizosaccharomyces pombe 972h-]CAA22659.1 sequence orphan [Schizosaccharomyces pombe]|eukprot:NP_588290.1 uncharacterized protein SPCC191.01 [Schizosaccharomyces pombe]